MLNGGPVAWRSRKQTVVAKSSSEAEYLAVSNCACEAIWFRNFFSEIGRGFNDRPLPIYVDNQAAIQMSQDPVYMSKTKHIDIAAHHIRDEVSKGKLHLLKIDGKSNPADILTKPLPSELHYRCIQFLGMKWLLFTFFISLYTSARWGGVLNICVLQIMIVFLFFISFRTVTSSYVRILV